MGPRSNFECSELIENGYKCKNCCFQTNLKVMLKRHQLDGCGYAVPLVSSRTCRHCRYRAFSYLSLWKHLMDVGCGGFERPLMEEAPTPNEDFQSHYYINTPPSSIFQYDTCESQPTDPSTEEMNESVAKVQWLQCNMCELQFNALYLLVAHIEETHITTSKRTRGNYVKKPQKEMKCKQCVFATFNYYRFRKHSNMHRREHAMTLRMKENNEDTKNGQKVQLEGNNGQIAKNVIGSPKVHKELDRLKIAMNVKYIEYNDKLRSSTAPIEECNEVVRQEASENIEEGVRNRKFFTIVGNTKKCNICSRNYRRVMFLKSHFLILHNDVTSWQYCEFCKSKYLRAIDLLRHYSRVHKTVSLPAKTQCSACNLSFYGAYSLAQHKPICVSRRALKGGQSIENVISPPQTEDCTVKPNDHIEMEPNGKRPRIGSSAMPREPNTEAIESDREHLIATPTRSNDSNNRYPIKEDEKDEFGDETTKPMSLFTIGKNWHRCNICNTTLRGKYLLISHFKSLHNGITTWHYCTKCDLKWLRAIDLLTHYRQRHKIEEIEPEAKCSSSNIKLSQNNTFYESKTEANEQRGINNLTLSPSQWKIGAPTENNSNMLPFIIAGKTYTCKICGKCFSEKRGLRNHFVTYHESECLWHPCAFCPYKFLQQADLQRHFLKSHKKTEFQTEFKCRRCKLCFRTAGNLQKHFQMYHEKNVKTFSCQICKRRYLTNYGLQSHMRMKHSGKKTGNEMQKEQMNALRRPAKHRCPFCMVCFTKKDDLRRHIWSKHQQFTKYAD